MVHDQWPCRMLSAVRRGGMGKLARAVLLAIATVAGALTPAYGQSTNIPPPTIIDRGTPITPLGWFVIGPVGWLLADALVPPTVTTQIQTQIRTSKPPPRQQRTGRGRNFKIPPQGETRFVVNELVLEFAPSATVQMRNALANTLQLTELETQRFELTGRTLSRWRIDGTRSVPATLRLIASNYPGVSGGWANMVYVGVQTPAPAVQSPAAAASSGQYVVNKLHLLE